ncbi:hypothetical protein AV521_32375 [Streptomyces sp. IMTB 2501]|uniref:hypothetical protein n=1 Tax=Streptomyces sp. IMTB 2501 TaxID=1776340 RepID=UPI00096C84A0|nr:hypothetical protein [Streptomyces sp. IMTB 2501]OLZ65375.1 hypothetical protein AV521_32375 [Streptomyces sp. IMTB 2501]
MTTTDSEAELSGAWRTSPTLDWERFAAAADLPRMGDTRLTAVSVAVAVWTRFQGRRNSIRLENGGSPCGGPYEFATAPAHKVGPRQSQGGDRYETSAGRGTEIRRGCRNAPCAAATRAKDAAIPLSCRVRRRRAPRTPSSCRC